MEGVFLKILNMSISAGWLVLAVVAGMVCGYFVVPESMLGLCSTVIDWGLYLLLLMVGIDMGRQGTIVADIRAAGFKVVLVPVVASVEVEPAT